ncbi:family 16 glycosylhydrolase [Qipengyuania sp.]|uniref:glycoside hydrolase family 16 protein n=1 Tax=Qipengyuania sp. TaxID=2004515 RepID=UPI0035C7E947
MKTAIVLCVAGLLAGCATPMVSGAPDGDRRLLFSDEFNGTALDRSKWNVEGPDFWVNDEQQAYLDRPDTIAVRDGVLVLTPRFEPGTDPKAERKAPFVSGRINTSGKFDFTYGRAEARIRMPDAVGVWPAFWLLGNGPWPTTGEIDIMEYVGDKSWAGTAIHGPKYSGETPFVDRFYFPAGEDATGWHTYAAEWSKDQVEFFIDGRLTYRVTKPMVQNYGRWAFDNPEYVIINFAMGGAYPGKVNGITQPYFGVPAETVEKVKRGEVSMEVDWVRVWAPE